MVEQKGDDDPSVEKRLAVDKRLAVEKKLAFEERLASARIRQGLDAPQAKPADGKQFSPWGIGLRVGTELVSALVVALAIGWGLDRWLGTKPILLAVFVLIGGAAGVMNVWRLFKLPPNG